MPRLNCRVRKYTISAILWPDPGHHLRRGALRGSAVSDGVLAFDFGAA